MIGSLRKILTPIFVVLLAHAIVLASDVAVTGLLDRNEPKLHVGEWSVAKHQALCIPDDTQAVREAGDTGVCS